MPSPSRRSRPAARAARRRSRGRPPAAAHRRATDASASTCSTSPAVTLTSPGSPSWSVSVVPSRSMPCHGTAKRHAHLVVRDREGRCPVLPALDEHVHALAQPDRRLRARVLEPADVVDPRAARVHDRARRDAHGVAVREHVGALPPAQCDHLGVVEDRRARVGGTANVCERQAPVVRHRVRVERAGAERLARAGAVRAAVPARPGQARSAGRGRASNRPGCPSGRTRAGTGRPRRAGTGRAAGGRGAARRFASASAAPGGPRGRAARRRGGGSGGRRGSAWTTRSTCRRRSRPCRRAQPRARGPWPPRRCRRR